MNIILTGSRGLIGSLLNERLKREGHEIVLEIDKRTGKDTNCLEDYKLDSFEKVHMVIHASAYCKINETIAHPELGHINALSTYNVLEFCRKNKIPKVVFFSSSRVLNKEANPYTAGKLYGEQLCKAYHDCYGIDYLIIRPSTVYGPFWDKTRRLIHIYITSALRNEDLIIKGDPETKTLDFTYVDDFVDGVMLAIKNQWNKEYNISGNEEYKLYDLAKFIIQETGSQSRIKIEKPEIAQPQQVRVDISEIKKIGYAPKIKLLDGVKKCIEWYKNYLQENPNAVNNYK